MTINYTTKGKVKKQCTNASTIIWQKKMSSDTNGTANMLIYSKKSR